MHRIESLLAARLFVAPQLVDDRLYFVSNLSGHLNLYVMRVGGSVPEPLLPPHLALQNPELMGGYLYYVFKDKILLMLDTDGDERYLPHLLPLDGGFPEPILQEMVAESRAYCVKIDPDKEIVYFVVDSLKEAMTSTWRADLKTLALEKLTEGQWPRWAEAHTADHSQVILNEGYTVGDNVLYLYDGKVKPLNGKPLELRTADENVPLTSFNATHFCGSEQGVLMITSLHEDSYGLGYLSLANPDVVHQVTIIGIVHSGAGEMTGLRHLRDDRYAVSYNIDGCSWLYEGEFNEAAHTMALDAVICGQGELANGVLEAFYYDKKHDRYALSFCSAVSPTQIYIRRGSALERQTNERVLGIPTALLAPGEDASFTSFDGTRISARLYLPAPELGYEGARPLVYYIHGGPQSQERPNFAWFSMPLIQFLTLNGFAVFVPNARGSTGYGLSYTKHVDHDWGGNDRLDHVHAMTQVLPDDPRIDVKRSGVVGRSYGGYMTLTLATRHPELWAAAVDMFGPYNLFTFMDRIPETWKPYFAAAVGDPEKDHDFLVERSPSTYIDQLACPMLVIQGKNDPRVIEQESREVVEGLRAKGRQVDYLMFENEGHDVLKYENRVTCYNAITDFYKQWLKP